MTLFALMLAASNAVSYDLGIVQESRVGSNDQFELQVVPWFAVLQNQGPAQGLARYTPRLLLADRPSERASGVLHRAQLEGSLQDRRRNRAFLRGNFQYGKNDFSFLTAAAEGTVPSFDRVEQTRSVRYVQADATGGAEIRLTRRSSLAFLAGYGLSGGARPIDRATVPLFESARTSAALLLRASRRDSLRVAVAGSLNRVRDAGSRAAIIDGSVGWERALRRDFGTDFRVGLSFVRASEGPPAVRRTIEPTASAGLRRTARAFGHRLQVSLRGNLRPFVDPVDGSVSLRPDATGELDVALRRRVALLAGGGVARSGARDQNRLFGFGFAQLLIRSRNSVDISVGVRVAAQPDVRWFGFAGFTFAHHAPL